MISRTLLHILICINTYSGPGCFQNRNTRNNKSYMCDLISFVYLLFIKKGSRLEEPKYYNIPSPFYSRL
jgi:hypothetical protein